MSWNQLLAIIKDAAQEREYWAAAQPQSCPNDGEPLIPSPPGSDSVLFCPFDGFQYPRDWTRPGVT